MMKEVESTIGQVKNWDPAVVAIGKVCIGVGLMGVVLWLSPYALTDLLLTFGLPLLIIVALLTATGVIGGGLMEMANSKSLGAKVQEYVKEAKNFSTEAEKGQSMWQ